MARFASIRIVAIATLSLAATGGALTAQAPARDPGVDTLFKAYSRTTPGCAVNASRDGRTLYAHGYGMADLEHDTPITSATPFYMASVSKEFAAWAIELLARDGKFSLDDDVRKWASEIPDFGTPITIRHLLHHTSGLRDYFGLLGMTEWTDNAPFTDAQFLRLMSRQRALNFAPGERFSYSNSGYVLLSIIAKRAAGKPLREYAAERIFGPLGMTSSQFRDDHRRLIHGRANAYAPTKDGWQLAVPTFDVIGDGGLYSTADDMAKWGANFDTPKSGDAATLKTYLERGVLTSGDTITYAAGLFVDTRNGEPIVQHGGAYGGYRTQFFRVPSKHLAVTVLCNAANANPSKLAEQVADHFTGMTLAKAKSAKSATSAGPTGGSAPTGDASRWAGSYWEEGTESRMAFAMNGGSLALVSFGRPIPLRAAGGTRYTSDAVPWTFAFDESNGSRGLHVINQGERTRDFRFVVPDASAPDLSALAGDYTSPELGVVLALRAESGKLTATMGDNHIELQRLFDDTYFGGPLIVRFKRENGVVKSLTTSDGRTNHVEFRKN